MADAALVPAAKKRIYFLDNLKGAVILGVIIHHAAMAYMPDAVGGWGIQDVRTGAFASYFVAWDDSFIMPLMFFVSGYFALASLVRHPAGKFLAGKWFRIGLPWLAGIIFLAPVTWAVSHPGSLSAGTGRYLADFWTKNFYPGQYWYLNMLMWYYLVLLAIVKLFPAFGGRSETPRGPGRFFFPAVTLAGFAAMFAVNSLMPDYSWCRLILLECQWTRQGLYFIFFLCGAHAWKNRWFADGGYSPEWRSWTVSAALLTAGYFLLRYALSAGAFAIPSGLTVLVDTAVRAVLCTVCSFALIGVFKRFADTSNAFWSELSLTAFAVYWIQQPVVNVFARWTRAWEFCGFAKYLLVVLLTAAASYGITRLLLLRLPFFAPAKEKK